MYEIQIQGQYDRIILQCNHICKLINLFHYMFQEFRLSTRFIYFLIYLLPSFSIYVFFTDVTIFVLVYFDIEYTRDDGLINFAAFTAMMQLR